MGSESGAMSITGTLKKFMDGKGFGFIERDDGEEDVFVHFSKLTNGGSEDMVVGAKMSNDILAPTTMSSEPPFVSLVKCTKTSSSPSSRSMKPNPFPSMNFLRVPVIDMAPDSEPM